MVFNDMKRNLGKTTGNFRFDFLPYKPGAWHPVASAPFKALKCFCLFGLWPKIEASCLKEQGFPERDISISDSSP
jgi:hypothetical protein